MYNSTFNVYIYIYTVVNNFQSLINKLIRKVSIKKPFSCEKTKSI